ncbi:hypothetical protein FEM48_Zijuj02G0162700 [Ziziphus jujuba var. spinosa]|uniref:NADP-dependent oxidoreductase domain-containing protein n=1 Tax=Ziziphus jujuba var. spinosa TaxID=714518 RepID=A0A978VWP0_ZIZJJ|nr:hypothetical protein FEM48_Zijuj02G0162700 [Ziziphus jujuba var. spinosa]
MAEYDGVKVPTVKLGNQGLEVSKLGCGCMRLSDIQSEEDGILIIKEAFNKGITYFDTADLYGAHSNELLVGKMGELKKLVEEGKIKYIGLSEASPDTIRRAHAVHPITALQMEWSLWTRDIEEEIVPLCRELGIGIVPYSPLGRGFFGGIGVVESVPTNGFLVKDFCLFSVFDRYFLFPLHMASNPRFHGENLMKNKTIYSRIETLARRHQCSPAQLAIAWILQQGDDVVPIPGPTKIEHVHDNIGSLRLKLSEEELKEISDAVPIEEVAGDRASENILKGSWKFADTPPKQSNIST